MSKLDDIAQYAEAHDFAEEMDNGTWEDDSDPDPMITTSLRMPKSLLDWVRTQAAAQHLRPSALIRQWIEQRHVAGGTPGVEDLLARVQRLELTASPSSRRPESGSLRQTTDMVAAAQRRGRQSIRSARDTMIPSGPRT